MLASVCYIVLATQLVHCEQPVELGEAHRKVMAVAEFYEPALDKQYYYVQPHVAQHANAVDVSRPLREQRIVSADAVTRELNMRGGRGGYKPYKRAYR